MDKARKVDTHVYNKCVETNFTLWISPNHRSKGPETIAETKMILLTIVSFKLTPR